MVTYGTAFPAVPDDASAVCRRVLSASSWNSGETAAIWQPWHHELQDPVPEPALAVLSRPHACGAAQDGCQPLRQPAEFWEILRAAPSESRWLSMRAQMLLIAGHRELQALQL